MNEPIYINLCGLLDEQLEELAARLRPAHILAYLAGADWRIMRSTWNGAGQVWAHVDAHGHELASVGVPLSMDYADYPQRVTDLLRVVAVVDEWPMHVALDVPALLRKAGEGAGGD